MELGLIHIYCGDGKGKTTAAMGLALRAVGHNKKVLLTQFLKDNETGELNSIKKLGDNFEVFKGIPVKKFFKFMSPEEQMVTRKEHEERFREVIKKAKDKNVDLLILDEIMAAINLKLVPLDEVMEFLKNKPKGLEVVLTGRNPDKKLIDIANYVSEIKAVKHPYEQGITSRIGIEK
ncbi:cob(I)yrinic acid a,c-diamide adenosyltransferase [Clostridium saccharobutylicum]|uniref:Cob(I)yrinic acid a,c-diamide adenosyltransferase BtuR n=1 Tax=Clostridium saccharobutylicum DSM 13864 TaxID=1345695 RepID=U5MX13_CLOSA|nr:cob(I)yrinic acid a,c-diamide adenosyltransferase [Clostridium saccharobutylicum]AGX44171.1 Cob(I)yrinic acid a,c-diamide adenosyltransferase BtuR [Clostridium saccharobutylicum DSM 13864]AQR91460.1 Cob(I)yrinic acid a,c-diamide adenosyltransferase [Clostridium saccharobutylicum]AQS01364.1 Cob(I)yrinic acid a,c-diamide adenosyltransferase [Clostridium saccharobutylicum]AQS10972.1 Cob(I)yrinic acid a,c-diamide adenosyltransferase [Clostridium saccharobutylicum]AQS15347.1 Cob(I)yrinic acid a,